MIQQNIINVVPIPFPLVILKPSNNFGPLLRASMAVFATLQIIWGWGSVALCGVWTTLSHSPHWSVQVQIVFAVVDDLNVGTMRTSSSSHTVGVAHYAACCCNCCFPIVPPSISTFTWDCFYRVLWNHSEVLISTINKDGIHSRFLPLRIAVGHFPLNRKSRIFLL